MITRRISTQQGSLYCKRTVDYNAKKSYKSKRAVDYNTKKEGDRVLKLFQMIFPTSPAEIWNSGAMSEEII